MRIPLLPESTPGRSRRLRRQTAAAVGGAVLSLLLFLLLPLMYSFSRDRVRALLVSDSRQLQRVHPAKLQRKQRTNPQKKTLRPVRSRSLERRQRSGSRFQLDLSLAKGGGSGVRQPDGGMIYTTGQVDTPPVRRRAALPRYPERARREGVETTVKVELVIDEQGLVRRVRFLKVLPNWGFEEAVRRAVRSWRFAPARLNDMPVRCRAELSIEFKL